MPSKAAYARFLAPDLLKRTLSGVAAAVREKVGAPMKERIEAMEARMYALEKKAAAMRYCGTWNARNAYEQGNFVTDIPRQLAQRSAGVILRGKNRARSYGGAIDGRIDGF